MNKPPNQTYSFDEFTLDLTRGCLLRGEEKVELRRKSFEVLKYLVENAPTLISKDDLINAVWGKDISITEGSLGHCITDIRRALDDKKGIIETEHGRGYRFIAALSTGNVKVVEAPGDDPGADTSTAAEVVVGEGLPVQYADKETAPVPRGAREGFEIFKG